MTSQELFNMKCIMNKPFKRVSLYQNQNTYFGIFIQGDINKYTLYMYCYKSILQIISFEML